MNVGLCSWAFARSAAGRREPGELATIAGRAGFAGLEGAYARQGAVSIDRVPPDRLDVPIASLATLELHRFSLADPPGPRRDRADQVVGEMVRCAVAWGIPSVSISPGRPPEHGDPDAWVEALGVHAALAKELGVSLALENVPGHLLERRASMARALECLPDLSLCLDVGNTLIDPPLDAWIAQFGDRVAKVHLSDGRLADGAWAPAWPGDGDVDWACVRGFLGDAEDAQVFLEVPWDGVADESAFVGRLARATDALLGGAR